MATLTDNIRLSLDAYEGVSQISSGWQRISQRSDGDTGFFGAAYRKGGEIVIAFRGWNDANQDDALNVLATYENRPFQQMDEAQDFVNAVRAANPGAQISLTGHSLGAALAAVMAVRNGLTAETFGQNETVDAAYKSMNGYAETFLGFTLWDISAATHNRTITRAGLNSFAGVRNHVVFGDIAAYNNRTAPDLFIGTDDVLGASYASGILGNDTRFGRWLGVTGDIWEDLVPVDVVGAPYSVDFASQIHSLGFTALPLLFPADMASLTAALPRLVLQLTNDWLARDSGGLIPYRLPFDVLDYMVFDHLNAPAGAATVLTGLFGDLRDIANAGAGSVARQDADINTALLQLAIGQAAREILDDDGTPVTGGAITDHGQYLSVSLRTDLNFAPEGARVARDYAAWNQRDIASRAGSGVDGATKLYVEANNGLGGTITASTGNDIIFGGPGADYVAAGAGNDTVLGFGGNDFVYGGSGNDAISGAAGNDDLRSEAGADIVGGGPGDDLILGYAGNDSLYGGDGADRIDGGADVDRIWGQSGADYITGGDGDDYIEPGAHNDVLDGGLGLDTFDFNLGPGQDTIYGFANNQDTLRIDPGHGFTTAAAVLAATVASGAHAVITLSAGNTITLANYLASNTIASLGDDIVIL